MTRMWSQWDPQEGAAIAVGYIEKLSLCDLQGVSLGLLYSIVDSLIPWYSMHKIVIPDPQKKADHGSPAEEGWLEIVCTLFEPHLWASLWIVIISVIFAIWYRFPVNAGFVKLIILVLWVIFCSKWTLSNCHH